MLVVRFVVTTLYPLPLLRPSLLSSLLLLPPPPLPNLFFPSLDGSIDPVRSIEGEQKSREREREREIKREIGAQLERAEEG